MAKPSTPLKRQPIVREHIVWVSLIIRLFVCGVVLLTGRWYAGDTKHYLDVAESVCGGEWGGVLGRPTFYAWFLCVLSPYIKGSGTTAAMLALPLLAQSFLVWACGVVLWKKWPQIASRRLIVFILLFDPVLLILGALVMSDALFSVILFMTALCGYKLFGARTEKEALISSGLLGLLLGVVLLTRSVGFPVACWSLAFLALTQFKKWRRLVLMLTLFAATIAPQFYWNGVKFGKWTVLHQTGWIHTVAAAVEYHNQGLDFYGAEERWKKLHRFGDPSAPGRVFAEKFPTLVYLSAKGVARVLFGHINVEWGTVVIGQPPIGPGWFKVPEPRPGPRVEGFWIVPWTLGLLLTALLSLFVYYRTACAVYAAGLKDAFTIWLLGCVALLACTPLVWGDARFRAPIFPLVLFIWAAAEARRVKAPVKLKR